MTEIDYYILGDASPRVRELFAIKLAEKALKNRMEIYFHSNDEQHAAELDQLLWQLRRNSFLPHEVVDDKTSHSEARRSPVLIGYGNNPPEHHQLLINLSDQRPGFFSSFDRMLELVTDQEPLRSNSRENFRFYRERGYKLTVHQCQGQAESIAQALDT